MLFIFLIVSSAHNKFKTLYSCLLTQLHSHLSYLCQIHCCWTAITERQKDQKPALYRNITGTFLNFIVCKFFVDKFYAYEDLW